MPEKSTEDTTCWRHLDYAARTDVRMLILAVATVLLLRGSDVLAVLFAWFALRAELPWTWT
jgi:hypothetical protein